MKVYFKTINGHGASLAEQALILKPYPIISVLEEILSSLIDNMTIVYSKKMMYTEQAITPSTLNPCAHHIISQYNIDNIILFKKCLWHNHPYVNVEIEASDVILIKNNHKTYRLFYNDPNFIENLKNNVIVLILGDYILKNDTEN